jgi:proteic killer suppression protein
VRIKTFRHAGLRRLYLRDDARGLPAEAVDKLRKQLGFLQAMATVDELRTLPAWKAHQLTGDRRGTWGAARYAQLAPDIPDRQRERHHRGEL